MFDIVLTGTGVNSAPIITTIPAQTIGEDSATEALAFVIGDAESPMAALSVEVASSNPALIPVGRIALGGSGAERSLTLTPMPDQSGTAVITVTLSDGEHQTDSSFLLTVTPINDAPTLSIISDPAPIHEGATLQHIALRGISAGPWESQLLTVTAASSNPQLVPHPTVIYSSPNELGTLLYAPAAGANGTAVITVTVNDGQSTSHTVSQTFVVRVHSALAGSSMGVAEGDSGRSTMVFRVVIDAPREIPVSVQYATVAGSAEAGSDFIAVSGTAIIPVGATEASIGVEIMGDTEFEAHESFSLVLSDPVNATLRSLSLTGTITNDDAPPSLGLSSPSVTESDDAVTFIAWIKVSVPNPLPFPVAWLVATRSGSAQSGSDFTAIPPTPLTFAPGETSKWVAVAVTGQSTEAEPEEEFYIDFSALAGPAPIQSTTCVIKRLAISQFHPIGHGIYALLFPTGVGQSYVIQESATPAGPWTNNSSVLIGSGSTISQVVFSDAAVTFFRIAVTSSSPGAPAVGP